jgi:hypothetical protein
MMIKSKIFGNEGKFANILSTVFGGGGGTRYKDGDWLCCGWEGFWVRRVTYTRLGLFSSEPKFTTHSKNWRVWIFQHFNGKKIINQTELQEEELYVIIMKRIILEFQLIFTKSTYHLGVTRTFSSSAFESRFPPSSVGKATMLRAGRQGFDSRQGLRNVLFATASRPALGPTQPPIQWVPGAFTLRVKRPGREADHSPPSSVEIKNACMYTSTPNTSSWHGA